MYKIVKKETLSEEIYSMSILAPRVAKTAKPGQFVIVIADEKGERLPFTVCDTDIEEGTVEIVIQKVGYSTKFLDQFEEGDSIAEFAGPLGMPSEFLNRDIEELKKENLVFIAGGLGAAPVFPQVKWFGERGIDVDVILGARNKEAVILEERLKEYAKNVYVCTDDGSCGFDGMVTDRLKDLIENENKVYDRCVAIGPMIMMKFVCLMTEELDIPTTVSMNPIMVDGTGMCGACRLSVGEETKFACVDGPEFDGHLVDFDEAMKRAVQYRDQEIIADHECKCGGGNHNG